MTTSRIFVMTLIVLIFCLSKVSAQTIPNSGFETWTGSGCSKEPSGWGTINGQICLLGNASIDQATGADARTGTFALKAVTRHIGFPVNQTAPGITTTGTINTNTQLTEGGFVCTSRPDKLIGWYKYAPVGTDNFDIDVVLWRRNGGVYEKVGEGTFSQSSAVSSYTKFELPISYLNANTPDSAQITIVSSNPGTANSTNDGTTLIVDDLEFISCAGFSVSVGTTDVTTNGGSDGTATANLTGGTATFSYLWSTAATTTSLSGLTADTYCVTVTDGNGCTTSGCGVVSSPSCANFTVSVGTSDVSYVGLNDGTATAMAFNGTTPYTYSWDNNATTGTINSLAAGTYSVTVTDSLGCQAIGSGLVSDPDCSGFSVSITPTDASGATVADGSATVSETGGSSPYSYNWSNGGTSQTISGVVPDAYEITVTDNVGCTASATTVVSFTVGVADSQKGLSHIYPNPTSGMVTIELSNNDAHLFTLTDLNGKTVFSTTLAEGKNTFELSNTSKGIYVYSVKNTVTGKTVFGKLMAE